MATRAEIATLERGHLGGMSADLFKFYDLICPFAALDLLRQYGLDERDARALQSMYEQVTRTVTLQGAAGEPLRAGQSVL